MTRLCYRDSRGVDVGELTYWKQRPLLQESGVDEERMRPGHGVGQCVVFPSVLRHCWLGNKMGSVILPAIPKGSLLGQLVKETEGNRLVDVHLENNCLKWR